MVRIGILGRVRRVWDLIGRFEVDLVVVDITALGEQRHDTFRRIVLLRRQH